MLGQMAVSLFCAFLSYISYLICKYLFITPPANAAPLGTFYTWSFITLFKTKRVYFNIYNMLKESTSLSFQRIEVEVHQNYHMQYQKICQLCFLVISQIITIKYSSTAIRDQFNRKNQEIEIIQNYQVSKLSSWPISAAHCKIGEKTQHSGQKIIKYQQLSTSMFQNREIAPSLKVTRSKDHQNAPIERKVSSKGNLEKERGQITCLRKACQIIAKSWSK
ncbi:Hypothetical_protein [Hexamita inflata]|uniref:Hypothetical_protein n=1 Tax=Hexamita inflata TaxID=28002 RepID=A0AA86Q8B5_9EUKA|nr:Hypothetical protein HINF_LOCUS35574 [Hexamita inflata]